MLVILGTELSKLCAEARNEVLLVAPFIKVTVLEKLLNEIPSNISIRCITLWFPEEVVAGVSDLEVWNLNEALSPALRRGLSICSTI